MRNHYVHLIVIPFASVFEREQRVFAFSICDKKLSHLRQSTGVGENNISSFGASSSNGLSLLSTPSGKIRFWESEFSTPQTLGSEYSSRCRSRCRTDSPDPFPSSQPHSPSPVSNCSLATSRSARPGPRTYRPRNSGGIHAPGTGSHSRSRERTVHRRSRLRRQRAPQTPDARGISHPGQRIALRALDGNRCPESSPGVWGLHRSRSSP